MRSFRGHQGTPFNFDADFRGELIITVYKEPERTDLDLPETALLQRYWTVRIPAQDVLELVLWHLARKAVSMLEDSPETIENIAKTAIHFLDRAGSPLLRRLLLGPDAGTR